MRVWTACSTIRGFKLWSVGNAACVRCWLRLGVFSFLLLAACAGPRTAPASLPTTQQPVASPSQTGAEKPVPALPAGAVIEYRRSGGVAGVDEVYTIYADGRIVNAKGREWFVSPQEVARLAEGIMQVGFFQAQEVGSSIAPCCDRFSYTLTVSLAGQTHTIHTYDGAGDLPEAIQRAFDDVAAFVQENTAP